MAKHMLTTIDNPYNPFSNYDEWDSFDQSQGYFTSGLLARFTRSSDELSETDQHEAVEQAIDEIIELHADGFYKKLTSA